MKTILRRILLPLLLVLLAAALTVGISAQELDLGIPVEERPELFFGRTMPTHGEGKIAVFLIQFPDYKNDKPDATAEYYNQLYFSAQPLDGTKESNPWYGSVSTFYRDQSYGKLKLSGRVFDWYIAKHERAYYGDDQKKKELVLEAVAYYEAKGVDFGQFDGDGNGELDAVIYHFAGPADQDMEEPWYDGFELSGHVGKTGGGKEINSFIQLDSSVNRSERNSERLRRTICHELLHTLGMHDLYGLAWPGLAPLEDLMCEEDPLINPYYKILLGWTNKVTLVTADAADIQLSLWAESGETILVTDRYNGVFDEFYLIAYTEKERADVENEIRIWRVDARLNADKTAFLYNNLYYSPKPEQGNAHGKTWDYSPYLFMEEISAIPQYDNVLNRGNSYLYFREGTSLGPNSIPNTDTHDGRYTGIRIDDFKRFDTYATMDITLGNKDTESPVLSDELTSVGFVAENILIFNEHIYPAENWDKIRVTTHDGQPISAKITRSHYLVQEIAVIIDGDIPQTGYLISLPEGCVRDSSGNKNKAMTVPVMPEGYILEQTKTFVPGYYPNQGRRWEVDAYSFSCDHDTILVTTLGDGPNVSAFVEFLKLNANGDVIVHNFIPTSYEGNYQMRGVFQANDGSLVLRLYEFNRKITAFVCVDKNGVLRWKTSLEMLGTPDGIAYQNGILFRDNRFIDIETGEITVKGEGNLGHAFCYDGSRFVGLNWGTSGKIVISDADTFTPQSYHAINVDGAYNGFSTDMVYNGNGTYTALVNAMNSQGVVGYLVINFDSAFRVTKQVFLNVSELKILPNDGFLAYFRTVSGNHSNSSYHITRMDKNLNLMWETNIETSKVCFFVTASNEIVAFTSYHSPKREAYLLKYGSEDEFEIISHTMTHHAAQTATCLAEGQIEYWTCSDCGGYFADAEGANAITAASVILPKAAHVTQAYANVASTCTKDGSSGGTYCGVCRVELTPKTVVPATGHTSVVDPEVAPTCTATGLTEGAHCSVCRAVLKPQAAIPATGHTPVEDAAVAPTYEREGLTAGSHCGTCNVVLTAQQPIPRLEPETTAAPVATAAPVTTEAPATTAVPAITVPPEITAAPTATEAPVTEAPITESPAQTTGEDNTPAPASGNVIPVGIAVAVVAVIAVVLAVVLGKRK